MLASIIGMSIIVAILIIFFFVYRRENQSANKEKDWGSFIKSIIPLLLIFFIISGMFLITKANVDSNVVCETQINSTTIVGNTTSYTYTDYCVQQNNQASSTFFVGFLWLSRIVYFLIFTGFVFRLLLFLGVIVSDN